MKPLTKNNKKYIHASKYLQQLQWSFYKNKSPLNLVLFTYRVFMATVFALFCFFT